MSNDLEQECTMCDECIWYGDGREGEWSLDGGGHEKSECIAACRANSLCNYASISSKGYCHMKKECEPASWDRFRKIGM